MGNGTTEKINPFQTEANIDEGLVWLHKILERKDFREEVIRNLISEDGLVKLYKLTRKFNQCMDM